MSKELPDDAEAGGGLLVAVVQLAIALGAAAGGWVFDASGYQATFSLSAGILFVAALLAFAAWLGVARPRLLARKGKPGTRSKERRMARIFITGSTDGLGRAAARSLLDGGHKVVLHARNEDRASAVSDFASAAPMSWWAIFAVPPKHGALPIRSMRSGAWMPSSTTPASTP